MGVGIGHFVLLDFTRLRVVDRHRVAVEGALQVASPCQDQAPEALSRVIG